MRPLHLVGLRGASDQELIFHPAERAPLVLTSLVPAMDQEQILSFYQQVLVAKGQLPRIEVEWGRSLLPTDRRFLQVMRERHGAQKMLVVVRVLRDQPIVDLHEILAQPEIDAFEHVAISALDPMQNESLVRLAELAQFVTDVAHERYQEIADELGLPSESFNTIQHRLRMLLNPVDVLEAVNALIDVQDEAKAIALAAPVGQLSLFSDSGVAATVEDQVVWRILSRVFEARPVEEQVLLTGLALGKKDEIAGILGAGHETPQARLRAAQLIRNGELAGWAQWLREPKQRDLLRDAITHATMRRRSESRWLGQVQSWFRDPRGPQQGGDVHARILAVFGLINAGKYGRAEEELNTIAPLLSGDGVSDEVRGDFWDAIGWVRLAMGQPAKGLEALGQAVAFFDKGRTPPARRAITMDGLARGLRDSGRWSEAEPLFREALRLKEEDGASATSRAVTIHNLARGLRDNGRWSEAEPLFREALRLKEEAGDKAASIRGTMDALAAGLRANGRIAEADALTEQAARLAPPTR